MNNESYVKRIALIIILTNIAALLTLPWFFKDGISWILGASASLGNFLWLADNVKKSIDLVPTKSKLTAMKGAMLRMIALLFYAIIIVFLLKPNIILFGLGLLSAQIIIYLTEFVKFIKSNKIFRG